MLTKKLASALTASFATALVIVASWQLLTRARLAAQGPSPSGARRTNSASASTSSADALIGQHAQRMIEDGRQIFRYNTFGSEAFWGEALQLHTAIAGAKNGGVGSVSPSSGGRLQKSGNMEFVWIRRLRS